MKTFQDTIKFNSATRHGLNTYTRSKRIFGQWIAEEPITDQDACFLLEFFDKELLQSYMTFRKIDAEDFAQEMRAYPGDQIVEGILHKIHFWFSEEED